MTFPLPFPLLELVPLGWKGEDSNTYLRKFNAKHEKLATLCILPPCIFT